MEKGVKEMLRRLLFETRLGELLLAWLERRADLAIVLADELADQQSRWLPEEEALRTA